MILHVPITFDFNKPIEWGWNAGYFETGSLLLELEVNAKLFFC